MRSQFTFVGKRKRVGAYFNDGLCSYSQQADTDDERTDDDILVIAVRAALKAFNRAYAREKAKGGGLRLRLKASAVLEDLKKPVPKERGQKC